MKHSVFLTENASRDILEIWKYIAVNDSIMAADKIRKGLEKTAKSLENMPGRGHVSPELERIGITEYKEAHFKVYRMIYFIKEKTVFIIAVLDGRRDLQDILIQRSLRTP